MPPRGAGKELGRLFDAMTDPIYVIDDRRRITYLNSACAEWLGASFDDLFGRECRYRSDADPQAEPLVALADALCPPPEIAAGRPIVAEVVLPRHGESPKRAHFLPLGAATVGATAVLAWFPSVEVVAADDAEQHRKDSESQRLHALAAKVRRDASSRYALGRLLGDSPAMRRVRRQIAVAAGVSASLSIVGPAGSGRAHAARTVHYDRTSTTDAAAKGGGVFTAFAAQDTGQESLQETIRSMSRAAQSSGLVGTLLLTDVELLSLDAQAELTGFMRLVDLPIRIITTSRVPLATAAEAQRFRADLAAYLSTLVIEIPSLNSRPEDIALLAQSFLEDANLEGNRQLAGFTPEALDRLTTHACLGEVRELFEIVTEACRAAEGPLVGVADLPRRLSLASEAARYARPDDEPINLDEFLADIEKQLIQRAMQQARGNKTSAAKLLGLPRPRLYRRMVQLGLEAGPVIFEEAIEPDEDATPKK
jgi:DNA-binding NtrC family response regulator